MPARREDGRAVVPKVKRKKTSYKLPRTFKTDAGSGGHKKAPSNQVPAPVRELYREGIRQGKLADARDRSISIKRERTRRRAKILENRRTRQEAKRDIRRILRESAREAKRVTRLQDKRGPKSLTSADVEKPLSKFERRIQTDIAKLFAPEKVIRRAERADAARRLAKAKVVDLPEGPKYKPTKPKQTRTFAPPRGGPAVELPKGKGLDLGDVADFVLHIGDPSRKKYVKPTHTIKKLTDPKTLAQALSLSNALRGSGGSQDLKRAGLDPKDAAKYADAPVHVARALLTDPKSRSKTLSSIPGLLAGIVPGAVAAGATAVTDPAKLSDLILTDLKERYGEGSYEDIRKGLRKHGGVVYGLDVAAGGAALGRVAKLGARVKPGAAARLDAPRPRLRIAEGEPGVTREQRLSPNLFVHLAQRQLDRSRSSALKRRLAKDERRNRPMRGVLPKAGEVVKHRPLQAPTLRWRELGRKGRNVIRYEAIKENALRPYRHAVAQLNRRQKVALAYAIEHGLPAATSKEAIDAGRTQLARAAEMISERRGQVGMEKVPRGAADELTDLTYLADNYDRIFTPKLRQFADEAVAIAERYGLSDPSFGAAAALQRRRGPQALALDREALRPRDVDLPPEPAFLDELAQARERAELFAALHKKSRGARREQAGQLAERWRTEVAKLEAMPARTRNEAAAEVIARLDAEAAAAGLHPGGYFPHTPSIMGRVSHGDFTAGSRLHAKVGVKPTKYELARLGVVDRSPAAFERGVAANIKRRFQWDESARAMDELAMVRATNKKGAPIRVGTLKEWGAWARREGRDLSDYVVINGAKFRAREGQGAGELTDADFAAASLDGSELQRIGRAVDDADGNPNWADLPVSSSEYRASRGWILIPKAAYEALKPQDMPKGLSIASRVVGKGVKTIPSKLILGLNPSWAVLQVINDATLAALAGVTPRTLLESERFWRTHPEALERSQPYIGATHFERELTGRGMRVGHLLESDIGAGLNAFAEAMRAAPLKIPKVGEAAYRYRNPLDWLFQFTHWEADKFRRALLYKQVKREAWEQMGREMSAAMQLVEPLKAAFPATKSRSNVNQSIVELTKSREAMERFGTHVDRMMGNYTRFSPWERRLLERNVMFYGFLRFSLRFALWTMPTRHPVVSSIAGHLSQIHEDETRKLLGVRPDEPLLPGLLSKYYFVKDGKLQELPMQRANPALNALTQASGLHQLVGALPPLYQELLNQMASKDLYFNQPFRLEGDPALVHEPRKLERKLGGFGSLVTPGSPRFRIALSNLLGALAPIRTWVELDQGRTPLSSESLPWDPIPMDYTDEDIAADIEFQRREDLRRPAKNVIRDTLVIPFPRASRDKDRQKRYLRDLELRDQSPVQEKLDRIDKFDNDEYFDIWIEQRIERLEKERRRKLDRVLGRGDG